MSVKRTWLAFLAFVGVLVLSMWAATYSASYQYCKAPHATDPGNNKQTYTDDLIPISGGSFIDCESYFANQNGSAITAVATVFLGLITGGLVWLGLLQLLTTRTQLRAHVFPKGFLQWWTPNAPVNGQYSWKFRPVWENSGETAAEDVRIFVECEVRNHALPDGFDFDRVLNSQIPKAGLLAPKTTLSGGLAPTTSQITPQDIADAQNTTKFIYLYGRIEYRDIFPGTRRHITHFCWYVVPKGDPFTFEPDKLDHPLVFEYVLHTEYNFTKDA